jgi:hypothetical protein
VGEMSRPGLAHSDGCVLVAVTACLRWRLVVDLRTLWDTALLGSIADIVLGDVANVFLRTVASISQRWFRHGVVHF